MEHPPAALIAMVAMAMLLPALAAVRRAFGRTGGPSSNTTVARSVPAWMAAQPLTPTNDLRALLNEGYRRNVVVYCCVNEIASSIASLKPIAKTQGGVEIKRPAPLAQLLRRPNPEQSWHAFIEGLLINYVATGEAYIHKVDNGAQMPVQLWSLRPDRMKPKLDLQGAVEFWQYTVPGTEPQPIDADDVIPLKAQDPLDDYRGLSPLAVAARAIDLDNKGLDYLRAFFLNGASPAGILTLAEETQSEEAERIRLKWKGLYGGGRGWHELAVLSNGAKYQEIGSRPEKLGMEHIWTATETRICAAFGVPPILVQLSVGLQRSTFSNYPEAVRAFWSETLTPIIHAVEDALTFGLGVEFGGEPEITLDISKVVVLQEGLKEKRDAAVAGYGGGLLTLNEARAMWGGELEPMDDGDELKKPAPSPFGMVPPVDPNAPPPDDPNAPPAAEGDPKKKTPPPPPPPKKKPPAPEEGAARPPFVRAA